MDLSDGGGFPVKILITPNFLSQNHGRRNEMMIYLTCQREPQLITERAGGVIARESVDGADNQGSR